MFQRLSRRSLLKTGARLGVGAALAALGIGHGDTGSADEESEEPYFRESASRLTLGNRYYEVDFDKRNGAITRIFDKRGGGVVSEGNADGSLWGLAEGGWVDQYGHHQRMDDRLRSGSVPSSGFDWNWDTESRELTFDYDMRAAGTAVTVRATVTAGAGAYFDLGITIRNRGAARIDWIDVPHRLEFKVTDIQRALLPYYYTGGIMLDNSVFREKRTSHTVYYPNMEADLMWIETAHGSLATYALFGESPYWQSLPQFEYRDAPDGTIAQWRHAFAIALEADASAGLPVMRICVGEPPVKTLQRWRADNEIDKFPSVRDKLGDTYEAFRRSPTIIPNLYGATGGTFSKETSTAISHIDPPAVLHPVELRAEDGDAFGYVPDWWPPYDRFGGSEGYLDVFGAAQRQGMFVMPYTWPLAAHPDSPTATLLREEGLTLEDIAVRTADGSPLNSWAPPWFAPDGKRNFDLSPSSGRLQSRLKSIMEDHDEAASDLAFVDTLASGNWRYDDHPDAESPLRHSHEWLEFARRYRDLPLTVEGMYDRMSEYVVAGYYSGYRLMAFDAINWAGKGWTYFPAAAAMVRDKTLQYGDNLMGFSGWIHGVQVSFDKPPITYPAPEILRWSLAQGQLMTFRAWEWTYSGAPPDPWLALVRDFSHHVMGPYGDELVTDVTGSFSGVTETVFETATVTANWTQRSAVVGEHTLVAGGAASISHDGSVTGGVFSRYNGHDLSDGDHYLIEQRKPLGVIVRQPVGSDTRLTIRALPTWREGKRVSVTPFNGHGELVRRSEGRVRDSDVDMLYQAVALDAAERHGLEASIRMGAVNREEGIRQVALQRYPSSAVEHDGRQGRRPVVVEDWDGDGHDPLAFAIDRAIVPENGGDARLEVEFFDENFDGDAIGVIYDGVNDRQAQSWQGPTTGDATWRTFSYDLPNAAFRGRQRDEQGVDFTLQVPEGVSIGRITVTNADELERRTVAYYTIHDPTQGESLTQGLHLRGWTDATHPIADLDLDGLQAIYAWDAEAGAWQLYSPDVPAQFNTIDTLEQGRAYYVRVRNGQTLHWPDAPYGGVGFHLQPGRNLVCWLGTPDKTLTDAIAPLRGMKAEPLVSVTLNERTYDVEESRSATEPLPYGQAVWVEVDAVGPTRWLQF